MGSGLGSTPPAARRSLAASFSFRGGASPTPSTPSAATTTSSGSGGRPRSRDTGIPGEWAIDLSGLELHKKYLLRVRGKNARGWSEWSERAALQLEFPDGGELYENDSEEDEEEDEVEDEEEGEEEEITVTLGDGRLGIDFVWPYIEKVDPVRFCSL